MKTCKKCGKDKNIEDFSIGRNFCKECINAADRERRRNKPKIIKEKPIINSKICIKCEKEKDIKEFRKGRRTCIKCENLKQIEYRKNNRDKVRKIKKIWREKNRDKENIRTKEWRNKNKNSVKFKEKRNNYDKNKRKTDPLFKMKEVMRRILRRTLLKSFSKKTNRTVNILGYTPDELKKHIETLFLDGMSWDNYGKEWHIDHTISISLFSINTPPNIINALSNLKPMWAKDNLVKGNKYIG